MAARATQSRILLLGHREVLQRNEGSVIAYLGDEKLKEDILAELDEHRKLDQIVKGTYGEGTNGDWRGCAVGCSIHSLNRKRGTKYKTGDHSAYEAGFGIPQALAYLEDGMFENLPDPVYLDWPKRFMAAIHPGTDLSLVVPRFLHWLLIDPDGIRKNALPDGLAAIDVIAELYRRMLAGETITDAEWSSAAWSAWSAAWSAWSAWSAAGSAAYIRMADKVIELLETA